MTIKCFHFRKRFNANVSRLSNRDFFIKTSSVWYWYLKPIRTKGASTFWMTPFVQLHLYTMMNKVGLAEWISCDGTIDLLYASNTKYFELKYFSEQRTYLELQVGNWLWRRQRLHSWIISNHHKDFQNSIRMILRGWKLSLEIWCLHLYRQLKEKR